MSLQTNLEVILLLLNDIRSGAKVTSNDTKALRYLISNVHNAAVHKKMSSTKDIELPDYVYMTEAFKKEWESAGKPSGDSALKKIGIHEHATPLSILIQRMSRECLDTQSIFDFISDHHKLVFVTKKEDDEINAAGYQRSLPQDGKTRYEAVGIDVHPEPVLFKNYGKYKR